MAKKLSRDKLNELMATVGEAAVQDSLAKYKAQWYADDDSDLIDEDPPGFAGEFSAARDEFRAAVLALIDPLIQETKDGKPPRWTLHGMLTKLKKQVGDL